MKRQTQISTSAILFLVGLFMVALGFLPQIYYSMPHFKGWVGLATLCVVIWSAGQLYLRFAKSRISK